MSTFRSLGILNYRIWFFGALISNIGTWMQRTAQDWLVFDHLTAHDAGAMGITLALQLGPQLFLAPWAGLLADRYSRRKLLLITLVAMALLSTGLGVLVLLGVAELWHVYLFALMLGIVTALDAPVRQTFVSELVTDDYLPNAVALNSASFNVARMIGPAVSGVLTVVVGPGWVFLINTVSFVAMLWALKLIPASSLRVQPRAAAGKGRIREGLRYVRNRPDIQVVLVAIFIVGTFGLNFPLFIAAMVGTQFGMDAGAFGALNSVMAIGSVTGALLAARRGRPRLRLIFGAAGGFGISSALAALAPNAVLFGLALVPCGLFALTLITSANGYVQSTTEAVMRGRVMSLYMAIFMGGTPIGAPLVGLVANVGGPRWAVGVAAVAGVSTAVVGLLWIIRAKQLRLRFDRRARGLKHFRVESLLARPDTDDDGASRQGG
ncbi:MULTISPECIES: MFS transporter [Micrococcaceae]|jgi:MFS family permease|uniref:Transmembrane efflux protein (MFS) n=1 Tax=Paenarthrobacter aurescens (strain TC1) TaxID=290340 RepID=A1R3J2_PAEAT|nr:MULTISPECIES: MFS transporter [Micrococcaceae]ABM08025.1 putative transmembrane efflux protein (MFS) [Paenarthrobacter aurescens TC1]AFR27889.1 putative transmembrane efflux protein (MFS) [Arthrobacter sp. Rue61a]MBP2267193.1 MFS family permease [Pseudarthrobacter sp. PvP004]